MSVPKIELLRQPATDDQPVRWVAMLGSTGFPVLGYEVHAGVNGDPVVILEVSAGSVRIGGQAPAAAGGAHLNLGDRGPLQPWGAPGPDPREGIPGWEPPAAPQIGEARL